MHPAEDLRAPEEHRRRDDQSGDQPCEGSPPVGAARENAHQESRHDGRRNVGEHLLVIFEQRTETSDLRSPEGGDHDDDQRSQLADAHQLAFVGPLVDLGVEIHREERRRGVQNGAQRRRQRGEQRRKHDPQ